jgi:hypothetical protein
MLAAGAQAPQWARGAGGRDTRAAVRSALQAPGGVGLNASQAAAVEAALGRTLTLWQVRRRNVRAHAHTRALTRRFQETGACVLMHACPRRVCACRVALLQGRLHARALGRGADTEAGPPRAGAARHGQDADADGAAGGGRARRAGRPGAGASGAPGGPGARLHPPCRAPS